MYLYQKNKMGKKTKQVIKKIRNFRKDHNSNLNIFLVCICIVMIWRGLWNLLDMYFFPNKPFFSNLICVALGVFMLLIDDGKLGELGAEPHKEKDIK